ASYLLVLYCLSLHDALPIYFALRFIDEFELLPNIRFQINVGKLHLKQYEKRIIGVATDRRILKSIKRFGKLSDFENKEESILTRSEEHTSELQSRENLVCRL